MKKISKSLDQMAMVKLTILDNTFYAVGEVVLVSPAELGEETILIKQLIPDNNLHTNHLIGQYITATKDEIVEILPTDQFIEKHFDFLL